jgi:hypothetical protein
LVPILNLDTVAATAEGVVKRLISMESKKAYQTKEEREKVKKAK